VDAELHGVDPPLQWVQDKPDRHGWNTYENYKNLHVSRIESHPFVDHSRPIPPFIEHKFDDSLYITFEGEIYCARNIILSVRKYLDAEVLGNGRLRVRCFSYGYNARIAGKHTILRYDNQDDSDDYHKHVFDPFSGTELARLQMTRNDFPLLHEVLDEIMTLADKAGL
jgi:hypothetical protein